MEHVIKVYFDPTAGIKNIGDRWKFIYELMKNMTDREREFCIILLNYCDERCSGNGKFGDLFWIMQSHGFKPSEDEVKNISEVLEKYKIYYEE